MQHFVTVHFSIKKNRRYYWCHAQCVKNFKKAFFRKDAIFTRPIKIYSFCVNSNFSIPLSLQPADGANFDIANL